MKDYRINIFFSEYDEGFIADTPDREACSAPGDTPEEALREAIVVGEEEAPKPE
jgi:predicted RNase H-like HicB family nuclease